VTAAVVEATIHLIAQRGPSAVSLRDIAREADINYGLIHRYFGTKDDVLRAAFRAASEAAAQRLEHADDVHTALAEFWRSTPIGDSYTRMLAWVLLEGRDPDDLLGRSPAVARLVAAIAGAGEAGEGERFDPRLVAAATVLLSLGWRLFAPFLISAADLHDRTPEDLRRELGELVELMVEVSASRQ